MKSISLLLCSILCISCASSKYFGAEDELALAEQRMYDRNTLTYGNRCSFKDEVRRDELEKKSALAHLAKDKSQVHDLTTSINSLLQTSGQFCIASMNLQCNTTGFCDCGNSDLLGIKLRSIRENGTCTLETGSPCFPENFIPKSDFKCEVKSRCVVNSNGKLCTTQNLKDDLRKHIAGYQRHEIPASELVKAYCVCGAGGLAPRSSHLLALLTGFLIFLNTFNTVAGGRAALC